jgi:Protein of unknown function (DUF2490)
MKSILLALLATGLTLGSALAADQHADNDNLWLNYVGDHPLLKSPWGLHLEIQNRREDWGDEWQQLLIRPGLNYTLSPTITVSAGYGFVKTYPYGELPVAQEFDEHRLWEQVAYKMTFLGLDWQHRLRLEQRWIEEVNPAGERLNWRGENRLRYMLRTSIPLTADKNVYLVLWNEVFLNFGGNILKNHFDQNRAFIGIGRKLTPSTRLEIGFMEQTVQRRGGDKWEANHTASIWLMSNAPFGK